MFHANTTAKETAFGFFFRDTPNKLLLIRGFPKSSNGKQKIGIRKYGNGYNVIDTIYT